MHKINCEMAKHFNIQADYWLVLVAGKKAFKDFKKFCLKQKFSVPEVEWNNKYLIFKVPVDRANKRVLISSGGITIWGPVYRQIGLIYDPYAFQEDYLSQE